MIILILRMFLRMIITCGLGLVKFMLVCRCKLDITDVLFTETCMCEYAGVQILIMTPDPNLIVLCCLSACCSIAQEFNLHAEMLCKY